MSDPTALIPELLQLLHHLTTSNDTQRIQQATSLLKSRYLNKPACLPALLTIATSRDPQIEAQWQIKQLAAVEARKCIARHWESLDEGVREEIKKGVLETIVVEQHNLVRHSLAVVIAAMAKMEIPQNRWGDLITFLYSCSQSPTAGHREIGVYVLYSLFETIAECLADHIPQLFTLFSTTINDGESYLVRLTTLQALGEVAQFIEADDQDAIAKFRALVPNMVAVLQHAINQNDDDAAATGFEVFTIMLTLEAPLLTRHLQDLLSFVVSVASNSNIEEDVRVKALHFLGWAIKYRRKNIQRLKLVPHIVAAMFPIAAEEEPDDDDDELVAARVAFQVIDTLATELPAQQVVPDVMQHVINNITNQNPGFRKAALIAMAVLAEGCGDLMSENITEILGIVCNGFQDPELVVRKAACMALGVLAEEFESEVGAMHATVLPLLFDAIEKGVNTGSGDVLRNAMVTLDSILSGLEGDQIEGYLPVLMQRM
ncbi:hypothetical protein HK102_005690, partial [Quaeritorhiza haematococci]